VLRRLFEPKRDEVIGRWGRWHNEALRYIYSSPNVIRIVRSRRLTFSAYVTGMGEMIK
jgi:hypothetical protein